MKRQEYLISKGCEGPACDWLGGIGIEVPAAFRRGLHLCRDTGGPLYGTQI